MQPAAPVRRRWRREPAQGVRDRDRRDHADRDGRRCLPGRPESRALTGPADRPLRSVRVPLAGRGPGRRLRPAGVARTEGRPAARPVQPVRPCRRAARARRCAPRSRRPQRPEPRADRDLPRQRARWHRLRGVTARALHGQGHPPGGAEPRAGGVRWRGPGQPRDRARRARPDPVDGQLVRLRERGARRGTGGPARRPGRRGDRRGLRGAAERPRVRCLRHHSGALVAPQRRTGNCRPAIRSRPRRVCHGRGRRVARAGNRGIRACARRRTVRGIARLRGDLRRLPHGPAASRRARGRPGRADRAGGCAAWTAPRSTT